MTVIWTNCVGLKCAGSTPTEKAKDHRIGRWSFTALMLSPYGLEQRGSLLQVQGEPFLLVSLRLLEE